MFFSTLAVINTGMCVFNIANNTSPWLVALNAFAVGMTLTMAWK